MMNSSLQDAVNQQINNEFRASYLYLAMSAWARRQNYRGFSDWLHAQSLEEYAHAMKLYQFMDDWDGVVILKPLDAPPVDFPGLKEVFEQVYEHEQKVSAQINALYEIALAQKAYGFQTQLQWFLTEQIEEERTSRDIVAQLNIIGSDIASLLALDRELGAQAVANRAAAGAAEAAGGPA